MFSLAVLGMLHHYKQTEKRKEKGILNLAAYSITLADLPLLSSHFLDFRRIGIRYSCTWSVSPNVDFNSSQGQREGSDQGLQLHLAPDNCSLTQGRRTRISEEGEQDIVLNNCLNHVHSYRSFWLYSSIFHCD